MNKLNEKEHRRPEADDKVRQDAREANLEMEEKFEEQEKPLPGARSVGLRGNPS
jgi:hypothetical protein